MFRGKVNFQPGSMMRCGHDVERSARGFCAFAHRRQAESGESGATKAGDVEADTVVLDRRDDLTVEFADLDPHLCCTCVLADVGQRFLDDAQKLHLWQWRQWQPAVSRREVDLDRYASLPALLLPEHDVVT